MNDDQLPFQPPRALAGTAILIAALGLGGCGKGIERESVYPVHGRILFQGKPAEGAVVFFWPVGGASPDFCPHGIVNEKGEFSLSSHEREDGAGVGDYVVTIDWRRMLPSGRRAGINLVADKYATLGNSPLRATVLASVNHLPHFDLAP